MVFSALKIIGCDESTTALLVLLIMSLPLFEAPKNIFLALFIISSLVNFYLKNRHLDILSSRTFPFVLFILSAVLAGITNDSWMGIGAVQWLMYPLAGLCVATLNMSFKKARLILLICLVGGIIAFFEVWFWRVPSLELRSVGYVTQSAVYAVMLLTLAVGFIADPRAAITELAVAIAVLFFGLSYLALATTGVGMVGGLIVSVIFFTSLMLGQFPSKVKFLIFGILGVAVSVAMAYGPTAAFFQGFATDAIDSVYGEVNKSIRLLGETAAILHGGDRWLGVGIGEFESAQIPYDPQVWSNHGHGLITTLLVERGWVGLTLSIFGLGVCLACCIAVLVGPEIYRLRGYIGVGIVVMVACLGLIQTTLHLEHGLLAFLVLGISISANQNGEKQECKQRLNIFTFGNERVPSTRFRVIQYQKTLKDFFDCQISNSKPSFKDLINESGEVILIQKRLLSSSLLLVARSLARGKFIYDFDDAIWEPSNSSWSQWTRIRTLIRFNTMMICADQVHVSSAYLGRKVPAVKRRIVPVSVPNVDIECFESERMSERPICFGWSGKASSSYQLKEWAKSVPADIFKGSRFVVLSGDDPSLNFDYEYWPFSADNEVRFYRLVDVGIVPSTNSKFDLGKTPVKALQHFAHGSTVIASPKGGAASEFIDRDTAIIVKDGQWVESISQVIQNEVNLDRLSAKARSRQRALYSSELTAGRLVELINQFNAADRRNTS